MSPYINNNWLVVDNTMLEHERPFSAQCFETCNESISLCEGALQIFLTKMMKNQITDDDLTKFKNAIDECRKNQVSDRLTEAGKNKCKFNKDDSRMIKKLSIRGYHIDILKTDIARANLLSYTQNRAEVDNGWLDLTALSNVLRNCTVFNGWYDYNKKEGWLDQLDPVLKLRNDLRHRHSFLLNFDEAMNAQVKMQNFFDQLDGLAIQHNLTENEKSGIRERKTKMNNKFVDLTRSMEQNSEKHRHKKLDIDSVLNICSVCISGSFLCISTVLLAMITNSKKRNS